MSGSQELSFSMAPKYNSVTGMVGTLRNSPNYTPHLIFEKVLSTEMEKQILLQR